MSVDILEGLRAKEEEISAIIEEARLKASSIREAAVRRAKEIKTAREIEAHSIISEAGREQERIMREEAASVESKSIEAAKALRVKGTSRLEEAAIDVVRIVSGPYKGPA